MGEVTGIAWTHHTWSPWRGCARVSPGCEHCYAETLAKRFPQVHGEWGVEAAGGTRVVASAQSWREVLRWNERARRDGVRRRVFPSMCDPFDTHPVAELARPWLWALIEATPHLDWLLLTKRVENVRGMVPESWVLGSGPRGATVLDCIPRWPRNAWLGTTVEDQRRADERIPLLVNLPAPVRFLSVEPQLEHVDLRKWMTPRTECLGCTPEATLCAGHGGSGIHWVICGGESGLHARPFDLAWARSLRDQCAQAGVAFFMKQMGAFVVDRNDAGFDADTHTYVDTGLPVQPRAWPEPVGVEHDINGFREDFQGADCRVRLRSASGADPNEWPADLRVQQFPYVR